MKMELAFLSIPQKKNDDKNFEFDYIKLQFYFLIPLYHIVLIIWY